MKIAGVVLTLNEQHRVAECLKHLRPYVDYLLVVDGCSTDLTYERSVALADRVVKHESSGDFSDERNYAETLLPDDIDWVLHCDTDERFHDRLLPEIDTVIEGVVEKYPETMAFRFPRANLPKAENYPDYQVRLLKRGSGYKWSYPVHSVPTVDGVNVDTMPKKCMTMLDLPIWHLPRRTDLERPWWKKSEEENKDE